MSSPFWSNDSEIYYDLIIVQWCNIFLNIDFGRNYKARDGEPLCQCIECWNVWTLILLDQQQCRQQWTSILYFWVNLRTVFENKPQNEFNEILKFECERFWIGKELTFHFYMHFLKIKLISIKYKSFKNCNQFHGKPNKNWTNKSMLFVIFLNNNTVLGMVNDVQCSFIIDHQSSINNNKERISKQPLFQFIY